MDAQIVEKGIFLGNLLFCMPKGLLISAPGASLSAGVPGSLLGAKAPAGSPPAPYSRRSLRTWSGNQQGSNN
jgi:hypothetical protein